MDYGELPPFSPEMPCDTDLLQGTFSDFWEGRNDPNFPRQDGPFMSVLTWNTILLQSGFSGIDFSLDDYLDQPSSTLLISTAIEQTLPKQLTSHPIDGYTIVRRTPTL